MSWLALLACQPQGTALPAAGGAWVEVAIEVEAPEDVELSTLGVRLDELVLYEDGATVSAYVGQADDLLLGQVVGRVELLPGPHHGRLEALLREDGAHHALWSTGFAGDDEPWLGFDLEVRPAITLVGELDVELSEDDTEQVRFVLRPDAWFEDLDELVSGAGGVVRLEPRSGEAYDDVVERIVESTELGGAEDDD